MLWIQKGNAVYQVDLAYDEEDSLTSVTVYEEDGTKQKVFDSFDGSEFEMIIYPKKSGGLTWRYESSSVDGNEETETVYKGVEKTVIETTYSDDNTFVTKNRSSGSIIDGTVVYDGDLPLTIERVVRGSDASSTETFTYDENGSLLSDVISQNGLVEISSVVYQYDSAGLLLRKTVTRKVLSEETQDIPYAEGIQIDYSYSSTGSLLKAVVRDSKGNIIGEGYEIKGQGTLYLYRSTDE